MQTELSTTGASENRKTPLFVESKQIPGLRLTGLLRVSKLETDAIAHHSSRHCSFRIKCCSMKMFFWGEKNMLETNLLFQSSFSMVMFTSVMQQDGDSRDCFCFKVKPFCCMRQCTSLSEHLTRSQTVNVFFLLLLETLFFY